MSKYRLKEMEIEGFRIYSEKKKIKFFNNITVVYGRNGRGKTTLQDALGWLFNNDITRYAEYNREWSRVKDSHIRSLLQPDVSTAITAQLEDIKTLKVETITRTERDLKYSNSDFYKWFESSKKGDVLWANSLTQAKLQELAVAKGRDRLEILAPLLDLTEITQAIKKVEETLRKQKEILKVKSTSLVNTSDREGKEQYEILHEARNVGENITKELMTFKEVPYLPSNNNKVQEIKEWEVWCDSILNIVSADQSIMESKMNTIREKYFEIKDDTPTMNGNKLEEIEKSLAEEVLKINVKKERIEELKSKIVFIQNNIVIVDESSQIIAELNTLKENVDKDIHSYEANKENQLKESVKAEKTEKNFLEMKSKQNEIEKYHEVLLSNKKEIEGHYKKFILTTKEINESKKELAEYDNWLMKNTAAKNNEDIKLLEARLADIGDNVEELVNQNIVLDNSFNILCGYISDESCPLCGKNHESISELEIAILHQKKSWENIFVVHQKEIKEISIKLAEIRNSNIIKENKERLIKEIQRKNSNAEKDLLKVKESFSEFLKKLGVENTSYNNIEEKSFKNMLEKNDFEILQTIDMKSEIKRELNEVEVELQKLKNSIRVNKKNYDKCIAESNQIKREITKEKEKVKALFNSYNSIVNINTTEELMMFLKNEMALLGSELEKIDYRTDIIKIEKIEQEIFFKYKTRVDVINNIVMEIKKLLGHLEVLKENLRIVDNGSELEKEIKEIEKNIKGLKEGKRNLREIQRQETNKEIGKISKRISKIFEMLSDVSPWRTILPDAVVPDERERTNLVFRPVPQKLESSVEEYLLKTNSNSTFAFSGGQLSLLGLSIFLSQVADEGKRNFDSPAFETLFLDDPIQMLDTLRDDALVSLICDIARERQVIISTSDIDFANKLILSSRPLWKDDEASCGVIYYEQLYEDGPVISEITSQEWIESQRIYIPKIKEAK